MATVTGLTAARMIDIENASIVNARLEGDNLILTTYEGVDINVGVVKGAQGDQGPTPPPDSNKVDVTRLVAGHPLSADVVIAPSDIGAAADDMVLPSDDADNVLFSGTDGKLMLPASSLAPPGAYATIQDVQDAIVGFKKVHELFEGQALPEGVQDGDFVIRLANLVTLLRSFGKNATAIADISAILTSTAGPSTHSVVNGTVPWAAAKGGAWLAPATGNSRSLRFNSLEADYPQAFGMLLRFGSTGNSHSANSGAPFMVSYGNTWRLTVSSSGNLQLRNATPSLVYTGPVFVPGKWYFVAVSLASDGTLHVTVFDDSDGSVFYDQSYPSGLTTPSTGIEMGQQSASFGFGLEFAWRQEVFATTSDLQALYEASSI